MAQFNLSEYQTVQERIDLFWNKFPRGRLNVELVSFTPEQVIFKAECYADRDDVYPMAVDFAEERLGSLLRIVLRVLMVVLFLLWVASLALKVRGLQHRRWKK